MERIREPELRRAEATRPAAEAAQGTLEGTIFLQPIAAPSILGLYGFAAAQIPVAVGLIGFYPSAVALFIFPFAAFTGGLAQFVAGMWAYKARDSLATAMLGIWGAFWIAYGVLFLLFATGTLVQPTGAFLGLGIWFVPLALITYAGAAAATRVNWGVFATLFFLAAGAALGAAGFISGSQFVIGAAGVSFLVAAVAGLYTATGLLFEGVFGHPVLPLGRRAASPPIKLGHGEPGVMQGQ